MTCLYKEVAKERGYNKLNRMHYQLLEWNSNKFTKTVIHFYAEPIDANRDSIEGAQGNLYARRAWEEFHYYINESKKMMLSFKQKYNNRLNAYVEKVSFSSVYIKNEVIDLLKSIEEFKLFITN